MYLEPLIPFLEKYGQLTKIAEHLLLAVGVKLARWVISLNGGLCGNTFIVVLIGFIYRLVTRIGEGVIGYCSANTDAVNSTISEKDVDKFSATYTGLQETIAALRDTYQSIDKNVTEAECVGEECENDGLGRQGRNYCW